MGVPAFLSNLPDPVVVMLLAAAPIGEIRLAIPFAVGVLKMTALSALLWSILGNAAAVPLVYGLGGLWIRWTERRCGFWHRLTDRVLKRSCHLLKDKYLAYGLAALPIFVAVPLPGTGAWTAAVASFVFCISFRQAFPLILLGIIGSGLIVLAATNGIIGALG